MDKAILISNFSLLKRNPTLSNIVTQWQKTGCEKNYLLKMAKSGVPTLVVQPENGKPICYHSSYDPIKEAEKQIDAAYDNQTHALLLGFGLGYMAEALLKKLPATLDGPQIFVIEPDVGVFYSALKSRNLKSLLTSPRIAWWVGITPDQIGDFWSASLDWTMLNSLAIIDHPPSMARFKPVFERVVEKIRYLCNRSKGNLLTLMHAGFAFHSNNFANLAKSFVMPGVYRLFNKFAGVPAIIVAAGPSLDKNMHLLKEVKGKFPILAVDTAFRQLVANGIKPDIVCAADPSYENSLDFVGVENVDGVVLAVEPMTHPDIYNSFLGPKMLMTFGGGLYPIYRQFREPVGKLVCWGSIATVVFDLAKNLGADPLVFVGLDLSFADGRLHARGSYSDDMLYEKVNPYNSIEHEAADYILSRSAFKILRPDGTVLYTDPNMKLYKDWFEDQFRQIDRLVINATEGGAVDRYVTQLGLLQVIEMYGNRSANVAEIIAEALKKPVKADIDALYNYLNLIRKRIYKNENLIRRLVAKTKKLLQNFGKVLPANLTGTAHTEFYDILKTHDELCSDKELYSWLSTHQAKFVTRHIMELNNFKANPESTVGDWLNETANFFAACDRFYQYQLPLLDKTLEELNKVGMQKKFNRKEPR